MSTTPPSRVTIRGLRKSFGDHPVLHGVDLDVAVGEVVCLLGASGSGKSTILRCVNQLERPDGGTVHVDGELIGFRPDRRHPNALRALAPRELRRQRADIGMVFQSFNLFPHLTVLQNIVEAPVAVRGRSSARAREIALELLDQVGLADRADAYPRQLSGGQQQRVAIARALSMDPKVMLFDEPTSALDPELVADVLGVMRDLAGAGMTMLVVTHELGFARQVADRVAFVDDGRIVEVGPPGEVLESPRHPRAQRFLAQLAGAPSRAVGARAAAS